MQKGPHANTDQHAQDIRWEYAPSFMMARSARAHIHLHHNLHGMLTRVEITESALDGCKRENACPEAAHGNTKFRPKLHNKNDHPHLLA